MGSGFKDWAAGDVLTAADVDGYLMRQTVMTFADASARDTALSGVLDEGMMAYLEDTNVTTYYDGSSWEDIRGLGGGAATSPGSFSSGDVLDAADLNGLPAGVIDYSRNSSPAALTTSEQDYATSTFTAVSGRLYFVTGALLATAFDAAGVLGVRLFKDGNRIGESLFPAPSTSLDFVGGTVSGYFTGSGSVEIDLRAFVLAGATSASVIVTGEVDPYLMIRDVGPS